MLAEIETVDMERDEKRRRRRGVRGRCIIASKEIVGLDVKNRRMEW